MDPKTNFTNIDEYISMYSGEIKTRLEKIRETIKKAVPEAVETISYKMPTFKLQDKPLAHFAAFKNHIGLYPPVHSSLRTAANKYSNEMGNLQFKHKEDIPYELITKIVSKRTEKLRTKE